MAKPFVNEFSHRVAIGRRFGSRIAAGDAIFQTGPSGICELPCTVFDEDVRQMSGPNLFVLLQVMKDRGWTDSRFFTVDQARRTGWTISPDAAGVRLQYLVATGDDGLPLEVPTSRTFMVFNAGEIKGVPALKVRTIYGKEDLEKAVESFGAGWVLTDGLNLAMHNWLFDLQKVDSVNGLVTTADMTLRTKLAVSLLQAQVGFSFEGDDGVFGGFSKEWAEGIENDPLSFFRAVRDAENLSATVMAQVRSVAQERLAVAELGAVAHSPASPGVGGLLDGAVVKGGLNMARKDRSAARIARMFEEREAVLAVPFADKDRASALGAAWFGAEKLWFVPKGLAVEAFKEWNPREHVLGPVASRDALIDSFRDAMAELCLNTSGEVKDDGKWHSVSVISKTAKNLAGSYILSLDGGRNGEAIGTIINRHSGESFTWRHEGALLTPEQKARMRAEVLAREETTVREAAAVQEVAAGHAGEIWAMGGDAAGHGYVTKKGIDAVGLRQVSGAVLLRFPEFHGESGASVIRESENYLLVPMTNEAGTLRAVQAISADGSVKSFMRGAQKKGTMMVLGADSFDALCGSDATGVSYSEGLATGASFRAASGLPAVVCFDAGNLETVVAQTAERLPLGMPVVLAVDNDQFYVERAVGFLSNKLGLNPHGADSQVVKVMSGANKVRQVTLGEAVADGEWHQTPKGGYRVTLSLEETSDAVRSILVEVVPVGGRTIRSMFENRGLKAGRTALASIEEADGRAVMAIPEFKSLVGRPTDWNDLYKREGLPAVRGAIGLVKGLELKEPVVEKERRGLERERGRGMALSR